jgi:hypothetical protein
MPDAQCMTIAHCCFVEHWALSILHWALFP